MKSCDVIFVMPYPFADHPSFPEGMLNRALEGAGFTVGVVAAPFWQEAASFTVLGRPRLFFAVIGGPVDSVVLNYTSTRKRRREDLYQPDGRAFFPDRPPDIRFKIRPDRCVTVFCSRLKQVYKDVPIVIGGVEAGMRRFAHYDFQEEKLRRSILLDSRADLLVCGMGERQIVAIARALDDGADIGGVILPGTARVSGSKPENAVVLPSCEEIQAEPRRLITAYFEQQRAARLGLPAAQGHANRYVVEQPPEMYTPADLEAAYAHPYTRRHPDWSGYTPALRMNLFSVTSHRGCAGACTFCSIRVHEGRRIVSRRPESIAAEIERLRRHPEWRGVVSDIGGASAEMYGVDCRVDHCSRDSCLAASPCPRFDAGGAYLELLRACRRIPGVKKIFLGSGVRHDVLLQNPELVREILEHHSGRFVRIAPEHTDDGVLRLMNKPSFSRLEEFTALFHRLAARSPRPVALAPYLIVGFPGETAAAVSEMRRRLARLHLLETADVQIFTPTPGTLATAMYYAGCDADGNPLAVERNVRELQRRQALLSGKARE